MEYIVFYGIYFILLAGYSGFGGVVLYHVLRFGVDKKKNQVATLMFVLISSIVWGLLFIYATQLITLYDGQII